MTTNCQRCHEKLPEGFRYGRRKYCVPCRNRIAHEQNMAKSRRMGYKVQRNRPMSSWLQSCLREWSREAQESRDTELEPICLNPRGQTFKRERPE